jgi:hypothetical protein
MDLQALWSSAKPIIPSIIGSGLGTTLISMIFKRRFDKELERQKATLQRGTKIHEHQVELLSKLYRTLIDVQELTISLSVNSQRKPISEESFDSLRSTIYSARSEYLSMCLYLPEEISAPIDDFFDSVFECTNSIILSSINISNRETERSEALSNSHRLATLKIPKILRSIEQQARKLIHGIENG